MVRNHSGKAALISALLITLSATPLAGADSAPAVGGSCDPTRPPTDAMTGTFAITDPAEARPIATPPGVTEPRPLNEGGLALDGSTLPARYVSGGVSSHGTLTLWCVAPHAEFLLIMPDARVASAWSSTEGDVQFNSVDLTLDGEYRVISPAGVLVTTFEAALFSSAEHGARTDYQWWNVKSVYENPGVTLYPLDTSAWGNVLSRYFTLQERWYDNAGGPDWTDYRTTRFAFSVTGPTQTTDGNWYGVALTHQGSQASHGYYSNTYRAEDSGFYVDNRADTYVRGNPANPAASYTPTSNSFLEALGKTAMDLAFSFVTSSAPWWVGPITSGVVEYILSQSEVPTTACQACLTDPWNGNANAGGILFNTPLYSDSYATDGIIPIYKQPSSNPRMVYMSAKFSSNGYSTYYGSSAQTWGVSQPFDLHPLP